MAKTAAQTKDVQNALAETTVSVTPADSRSFDTIVNEISDADAKAFAKKLAEAIDDRCKFEAANSDHYEKSMKPKLTSVRSKLANPRSARVLLAVGADEDFINRQVSGDKRYNIYALQKVADAVEILGASELPAKPNAINQAIIRSLFSLKKVGVQMTYELAKACCSKNYRPAEGNEAGLKHLTRHTVSPVTVSTQSSSTMNALATLGLVVESGGRRDRKFELADVPAVTKLASLMQVA